MATEPVATPLEREVEVDAPPETVFSYFTDPARMVEWMGAEATLRPEPGGVFRVRLPMGYTASGTYVELDPPRRAVFTWGWEGEDSSVAPGASTVEVEIERLGEGSRVILRHHGLTAEQAEQHAYGWRHYCARLQVAASGRDPGEDRGPRVPGA